jgi:acyl dehydratase
MTEACVRARELLRAWIGRAREPGAWCAIEQARIERFADATDDRQFIHVDPARAAASPFGGTVAHGFLTLSLIPALAERLAPLEGDPYAAAVAINYGLNRVRFPAPVRSGARVRLRRVLREVGEPRPHALLLTHEETVEVEGQARPGCVAETIMMLLYACGEGR